MLRTRRGHEHLVAPPPPGSGAKAWEVCPLLEAHGQHINTSTARLRTPSDVATFLTSDPTQTKVKETS
ncbi:hypothetical protein GCM10011579_081740 [Streptomyces albiflavescens]|uniref:Uncharacterized protein n=1 Tax=Streptomyces albiflavescens TaxID=1623582 RepID=A0A918D9W9_9ACTN|nr:hypothetical protein GCM10011579_081740 [Streptomyces albiflavescens]